MLEVRTWEPADQSGYAAWLAGLPHAMVYYAPEFQRFLQAAVGGEGRLLLALRGSKIAGALPFFRREIPGLGAVVNSLPWYGSHGGCLLARADDDATRRALLGAYRAEVSADEVLAATLVLSPAEDAARASYDAVLEPATHDHRIGQITRLPEPGPDLGPRLEAVLQQKTRNLARKACKQGFEEVVTDEDWAWKYLFETHQDNLAAIGGRGKPWQHFVALRSHIPARMQRLSVALLDRRPVAALLLLRFARTVEYVTPVIDHAFRPRQPLSFLIWRGMLEAATSGARDWNWGGTWIGQRSLHHFKAGWGAADRPYTYLVSLGAGGLDALRRRKDEILAGCPYYYVYPFSELDHAAGDGEDAAT